MNNKQRNKLTLCIGEVLWDVFPGGKKAGGAPMNAGLHLQKLGMHVRLASSVGTDAAGDELLRFLEAKQLDTSLIQRSKDLPTSEVKVTLDENNDATYEIAAPVAWDGLEPAQELKTIAEQAQVIVYGSLASRFKKTRATILELLDNPGIKLMDVNLRPPYDDKQIVEMLLEKASIAKLNEAELNMLASWYNMQSLEYETMNSWLASAFNLDKVLVSHGANGATLYEGGTLYRHAGYRVQTADTVGAGDAFLAGYVASLLNNESPDENLSNACAAGALVASRAGAVPEYDVTELEAFRHKSS